MANNDLLKEAIADAKAVKETAIANAKLALEEAFTPHLKSMLSAKLEEMDEEDVDDVKKELTWYIEDENEDIRFQNDEYLREVGKKIKEIHPDISDEDLDKIIIMAGEQYSREEDFHGDSITSGNFVKAAVEIYQTDILAEEVKEPRELDEIDLDELLAELELDENDRTRAEEEGYKDGMKDEKKDLKEDERTDAEEEGYEDGMEDEKEDDDDKIDDEEVDLEDMSEDDLKGFIEDVIKDLVADGTIEAGDEIADEDDMDDMDDVDVEVELDEDKKQGYDARLDDAEGAKHGKKKQDMKQRRADSENAEKAAGRRKFAGDSKMKEELTTAIAEVNDLKAELNEVNLLNAKLLYTNKIFKSKTLSEDKKVKVLKAFDKASTVKEAKVVFETLNEGLVSQTKRSNNRVQGMASKATGVISEAKKQPIIESNEVFDRMRKLAGLI